MTVKTIVTTAVTETITTETAETTKTQKKFRVGETIAKEAGTEARVTTGTVKNTINNPPRKTREKKTEDTIELKSLKNLGNKQFQQALIKMMISLITPNKTKD